MKKKNETKMNAIRNGNEIAKKKMEPTTKNVKKKKGDAGNDNQNEKEATSTDGGFVTNANAKSRELVVDVALYAQVWARPQ